MSAKSLVVVAFSFCATACGGVVAPAPAKTEAKVDHGALDRAKDTSNTIVCAETQEAGSADQIAAIEIRGARAPQEFCSLITSAPGKPFQEERIDADVRALWREGNVEDVMVIREDTDRSVLVYQVRMRPSIVSFEIRSADPSVKLPDGVHIERPTFLNHGKLQEGSVLLANELRGAGWMTAKVGYEITPQAEGSVGIVLRVEPGPRTVVRSFRLEGPSKERIQELLPLLNTSADKPFYLPQLARDALVIQADGYDRGLVMTKVEEPDVEVIDGGKAVNIVLRVNEGAVYRIGKLSFAGDLIGSAKPYEKKFWTSAPKAIFSRKVVAADIEKIRAFHESKGSLVDITPETTIDAEHNTIDVVIRITQRR